MKFVGALTALAAFSGSAAAFTAAPSFASKARSQSSLSMVLEKPKVEKKLSKLENLKIESDYLIHPLKEVRYMIFAVVVCSLYGRFSRNAPLLFGKGRER